MKPRGFVRVDGRTRFIVTYDISNPKRLRKVHKVMKDFGEPLQYSVFCCDLTASSRVRCEMALKEVIHHTEDQVLFVDLGPASGRGKLAVVSVGRQYTPPERRAMVV